MNPRDKAKELVEKYLKILFGEQRFVNGAKVKQCALIAVDEVIKSIGDYLITSNYWKQVKEEIEKL